MFFFNRRPWAIHNPLKSWTFSELSLRECKILVASMSDAETKVSWAHLKGWPEWLPLSGEPCHHLFGYCEDEKNSLPAIPELNLNDDRDHDITQVHTDPGVAKFREYIVRKYPRYSVRIPAEILVGNQTFKTQTLNVSEGGFFFESPLPDWVAGYFTVTLKVVDGPSFEFTCFLAEDQKKEKYRTEIAPITKEQDFEAFKKWLENQIFPVSE